MKKNKIISFLWGDLHGEEFYKFFYLALGAFCLIGSFWPLKPLKESIFINMIGSSYLPYAKMLTVVFCFPLVLVYSKLVDYIAKQKLIYTFVCLFSAVGIGFVYFLLHPTIGVANTTVDPTRYVAWGFYLFTESYLTLMVALYWSFISDTTSPESAKKGYGMVVFGSQTGGLVFSAIGKWLISDVSCYATRVPLIVSLSVSMFLALGLCVWLLTHTVSPEYLTARVDGEEVMPKNDKKAGVGFFEGLKVLLTRPYVAGIFGVIFFQEVITTVMGLQMSRLIEVTYVDPAIRTNIFFNYSVCLQVVACLFALFGTSYVHRKFGTRACLTGFPFILFVLSFAYVSYPSLSTVFIFMLMIKGLHYALNQPIKESLYIPTTKDIKYKSKAWIDMFGMRFSKYAGAHISKIIGPTLSGVGVFSIFGLALWTLLAYVIGTKHDVAVEREELIK